MTPITSRALRSLAVIGFILAVGWVLGQTATHGVNIAIPEYLGLRFVGTGVGPRMVAFDFVSDPTPYLSAIDNGTSLQPTDVNRFSDIELNVSRNGRWYLDVSATPLSYVGAGSGAGLSLDQVRVTRGRWSGLVNEAVAGPGGSMYYHSTWTLSTTPQRIASATRATAGWRSLGFSGQDYELEVSGDEEAGTYTTLVTYLLTAP